MLTRDLLSSLHIVAVTVALSASTAVALVARGSVPNLHSAVDRATRRLPNAPLLRTPASLLFPLDPAMSHRRRSVLTVKRAGTCLIQL